MKCKCGGEMLYRQEEGIFYCQSCTIVLDGEGNVLQGLQMYGGDE